LSKKLLNLRFGKLFKNIMSKTGTIIAKDNKSKIIEIKKIKDIYKIEIFSLEFNN
jgi:ABC-type enterochelin transport system ATPase subunit